VATVRRRGRAGRYRGSDADFLPNLQRTTALTRRTWVCCLLLAAVAIGTGVFFVRTRGIGPTSFKKIRAGMTVEQVETVIGLPDGDYYTRPPDVDWRAPYWGLRDRGGEPAEELWTHTTKLRGKNVTVRSWRNNYYFVHVAFDENGAAVAWTLHEILAPRETSIVDWIQGLLAK
jgi:hypothetical protein